jgi:hypothetical protein
MASSNDLNKTFAQLSSLLLFGSFISWAATGNTSGFTVLTMIYFMLVSTNAIKRGETSKKKK